MNISDRPVPSSEFESPRGHAVTKWDILVGIVPLAAFSPMLLFQLQELWSRPYMRFFPLVIAVIGWLAYLGWRGGESTHPVRRWTAVGILALATLLYGLSVWQFSPWLSQLAATLVFLAWALGRCGNRAWPSVTAWTGLLLTTLPLPYGADVGFFRWLQATSAWACGRALDALGIPFLRLVNVIQIRGKELYVEEVSSSVGSVYALLAVGVIILIISHRSLFVSILSLLSVPVWTILGNFAGLLTIVLVHEYYGRDASQGIDHQLLAVSIFVLAAFCFWLTQLFVAQMFQPVPIADAEFGRLFGAFNLVLAWPLADPTDDVEPEDEDDRAYYRQMKKSAEARQWKFEPMDWTQKNWAYRSVLACSVLLVCASLAPAALLARGQTSFTLALPNISAAELEAFPGEEALPEETGNLKKVGFHLEQRSRANSFGQNSLIWDYEWNGQLVQASLDFPFLRWHALDQAYQMNGHVIESYDIKGLKQSKSAEIWPWVEMELSDDLGAYGFVYFALFDENLEPFVRIPGAEDVKGSTADQSGILGEFNGQSSLAAQVTYQFQLFCQAGEPLSAGQKAELRASFLELRDAAKLAAKSAVHMVRDN